MAVAPTPGGGTSSAPRGLLVGVMPHEVVQRGIDLYDPELTVEDLWGPNPPAGAALLEAVLSFYSDGTHDVPWYHDATQSNGSASRARSIVRSPLSRELQEATVQNYTDRIFRESISQVAAGLGFGATGLGSGSSNTRIIRAVEQSIVLDAY